MVSEEPVRTLARLALQAEKLPRRDPDRTWGGTGVGITCAICGQSITATDVECAMRYASDGGTPRVDQFHLHLRCFAAWELERTKT